MYTRAIRPGFTKSPWVFPILYERCGCGFKHRSAIIIRVWFVLDYKSRILLARWQLPAAAYVAIDLLRLASKWGMEIDRRFS